MENIIQSPYFSQSDYAVNKLDFQLGYLIRTVEDAQRIVAGIYQHAKDECADGSLTETISELESSLLNWNEPDFPSHARRAEEILVRLDEMFTETVDYFPALESIRIPIYALQLAIRRRVTGESVK